MSGWPLLDWALPAVLLWAAVALGLSLTALRRRPWALVLLIAMGVPVLGLVTHAFGPVWGLVATGLGMGGLRLVRQGWRRRARGLGLAPPGKPH